MAKLQPIQTFVPARFSDSVFSAGTENDFPLQGTQNNNDC